MSTPSGSAPATNDTRWPALFVSHGAPTLPFEQVAAREFLAQLGDALGTPRAVLAVSAHWNTQTPRVGAAERPQTIHDFYGFPPALYGLRYPAPGDPSLARRVAERLREAGFPADLDDARGLDHGAWVPLMLMYPRAQVPVVQLAVQAHAEPRHHYELGRALRPLRGEGVLILASGGATHNLRALDARPGAQPPERAAAFSAWLAQTAAAGDVAALLDYRQRAPHAAFNHPTAEHFLPLFVAAGAGTDGRGVRLHESYTYGALAMDAYRFD